MCGIVAVIPGSHGCDDLIEIVRKMSGTLRHRGPDDVGDWFGSTHAVALAHRRLSIVDLSPMGRQPMVSAGGRFVIAFNGEIYNHRKLRSVLEAVGVVFHGSSDTEVLLAAFERWGVSGALPQLTGMFAIALWDERERALHLVRDRMGEKPLYYGWLGDGTFVAASELKAIQSHKSFTGEIDRDSLVLFLRHGYIPAPRTIWRGISKLIPGTFISININSPSLRPSPEIWWSDRSIAADSTLLTKSENESDAEEQLDSLLRSSISDQLEADVPVGAFLSGGIDSSTVVAIMQSISRRPVRTFTIGFREMGYDEAGHAMAVARHLGTEHTELYVTANEACSVIPKLPFIYDEPFADSSQIPTFLISQMARRHVTVALTGDGGDELFGGYTRYIIAERLWSRLVRLPISLRRGLANSILAVSPGVWERLGAAGRWLLPQRHRHGLIGDKLHKLARVIIAGNSSALYRHLISQWDDPAKLVVGGHEPMTILSAEGFSLGDFTQTMMLLDQLTYLPDDILVKVDRAAMAVGLETRVPMLDHRIIEFSWRLAPNLKIRNGISKWILRRVLDRYVPPRLIERPKMGFSVPIGTWLRGPLRPWAEALLDGERLRREGIFNPGPIRACWESHLSGRHNGTGQLWAVLMFQAWFEAQH